MAITKEKLAMTGFFFGVLFPIRYIITSLVGNHWLGSFGVISVISIVITYFAYKDKLGWFGKAFINFFRNRSKGKRKFVTIFFFMFTMFPAITMIYSVHHAEQIISKEDMMSKLPEDIHDLRDMDKMIEQTKPTDFLVAFLALPLFMITNFNAFTIMLSMVNELSHGVYLNLATVLVVEELEFIGLILFYRFKLKNIQT